MALVLAHRGASRAAPENTLEAFAVARRLGADGVELDVRRSADGMLVVHHDAEVPGRGPISSLPAAHLPPEVPSLEAALGACSGMVVNIELKDLPGDPGFDPVYPLPQEVARLVAEVLEAGVDLQVIVSSFDLSAIDVVRQAAPSMVTGWLTPSWSDAMVSLATTVEHGHRALHPRHEAVTEALLGAARDAGVDINTWTVDDPVRIRQLALAGVHAVITNVPDVARTALSASS